MRLKVGMGLLLFATACGAIASNVGDAGPNDAATQLDAGPPVMFDGATVPDASALDAYVACTDGDYYVAVVDEGGTRVFDGGCDGGAPAAFYENCGDKIQCMVVTACGDGSIRVGTFYPPPIPGSAGAAIDYVAGDAGDAASYNGSLYLESWPAYGGTVGGDFTTDAAVNGTFCVQRR